mgnify:CR=1 FL=1
MTIRINKDQFITSLTGEILFSTFQTSKILNISNITNWNEFIKIKTHSSRKIKIFKQDSCIFSYYILNFVVTCDFVRAVKYLKINK